MVKHSKTLSLVANRDDAGAYISIRDNMEPVITNSVPVGAPSITDAFNGSVSNNVSSAIEDLSSISVLPIGTVVINTTGDSPQGSGQVTRLSFEGKFIPSFNSTNDKTHKVSVLGVVFEIEEEAEADVIAKTFADAAKLQSQDNLIISSADYSDSEPTVVNITSVDTRTHNLPQFKLGQACTITPSIESPAKVGYGTWDLIGSVSQTFEDVSEATKLFYFKRIG